MRERVSELTLTVLGGAEQQQRQGTVLVGPVRLGVAQYGCTSSGRRCLAIAVGNSFERLRGQGDGADSHQSSRSRCPRPSDPDNLDPTLQRHRLPAFSTIPGGDNPPSIRKHSKNRVEKPRARNRSLL